MASVTAHWGCRSPSALSVLMVPSENQGLRSNETRGALWSPWLCAMDTGVVGSHSHWPVLAPPAPDLGAACNRCKLPAGKRHGQHRPGQVCTWTRGLGVDLDGTYSKDEGLGRALVRHCGPLFPAERDEDRSGG